MRIALCATIAAISATSCAAQEELTNCGEHHVLTDTFSATESFPQYYLPAYSVFGLPMGQELKLAMLSEDQLTQPSARAIDFLIPKGCYSLNKMVLLSRRMETPSTEFCFDEPQRLLLVPSPPGEHPCSNPICSSEANLKSTADSLNVIAKFLQSGTITTPLGSIKKSDKNYQASFEAHWTERTGKRVPIYRVEIVSEDAQMVVEGVHAAMDGSTLRRCRNRDLTSILATGG